MGIDFYTCENCGRNFPDCTDYFGCFTCGARFCSSECGGSEIDDSEEDDNDEDNYEKITTCVLCRKEEATDTQLLHFLLEHFNLTREQVMEMYRKED